MASAFAAGFAAALILRPGGGGADTASATSAAPNDEAATNAVVALAGGGASDSEAPPRLSLSIRAIGTLESADTQPVVELRGPVGVFTTNVFDRLHEWISLDVDGCRTPFSTCRIANSRDDAVGLLPDVETSAALIRVRVSQEFPAPDGFAPMAAPFEAEVRHAVEPIFFRSLRAEAGDWGERPSVSVILSESRCTISSVVENLIFDPPVPGGVRAEEDSWIGLWDPDTDNYTSGPGFRLYGAFSPETRYRMALRPDAALVSERGAARLAATNSVSFVVPKPDTRINFCAGSGGSLVPTDISAIALRTQNAGRLRATLNRVLPQNVLSATRFSWVDGYEERFCERTGPELETFVPTAGVCTNSLALSDFFAPDAEGGLADAATRRPPDGLYRLRCTVERAGAKDGDGPAATAECLVNLSDIGISVRIVGNDLQAWVVGLASGAPVPGAKVTLVGQNNSTMSSAIADKDGVALVKLPPPDVPGSTSPALVLAETPDGGYGFLILDDKNSTEEAAERPPEGFPESVTELDGFLFSDRGIYRHGDRVLLQGLVRDASGFAPEPLELSLEMRRPDGNLVERIPVHTDSRGHFALNEGWEAPSSQPSGKWRAVLRETGKNGRTLAERAFSVEEFAPPKIVAEIPSPAPAPAPCATNTVFSVAARWMFGTPASSLSARGTIRTAKSDWRPAPWSSNGWSIGSSRRAFQHFSDEKNVRLDMDGRAAFDFDISKLRGSWPSPLAITRTASVFEPGGRSVQSSNATIYHPFPHYVAVRTTAADDGASVRAEVRLVRPDGSAADDLAGTIVRLAFFAAKWESRLERQDSGKWAWRTQRILKRLGEAEVEALADAPAAFLFTLPPERSDFEILAQCPAPQGFSDGPETVCEFSSWDLDGDNSGDVADAPNPVRLTLKSASKSWRASEEAAVSVLAPFAGRALVTIQGRGIASHFETFLEEGDNEVRVPVATDLYPSCELSIVLIRPVVQGAPGSTAGSWRPHRACGSLTLHVSDPARALPLVLDDPVIEMRPSGGSSVSARASLRLGDADADKVGAAKGRPANDGSARATFFLVDETLLDLTREPLPDPEARFGRARASRAMTWDSWSAMMPLSDAPLLKTAAVGGDDLEFAAKAMADAMLAGRVSPVSSRRFEPLVRAVSDVPFVDGEARARFDIPDFAGRLRVICVAWTSGAASAAKSSATVAPSLVAEADGPRFLCCGDVSEAVCTLHNNTDQAEAIHIRFVFDGAPPRERDIMVPARGFAVAREPVSVPEGAGEGVRHVKFTATGLGETRSSGFEIPVRSALPPRTFTETKELAPGQVLVLEASGDAVAGVGASAEIAALASDEAIAAPALRWLHAYQWGCIEQTVSRALPMLVSGRAMGNLSDRILDSPGEAETRIRAAIARAGSMLRGDGFTTWPDTSWTDAGYSAWAGFFIAEAHRAGFDVPQSVLTGARDVLRSLARRPSPALTDRDGRGGRLARDVAFAETRALALLGLASDSIPDEGAAQRLFDIRESISSLARARLAIVFFRTGHPSEGLELLRSLDPLSDTQSAAWALVAWLESPVSPDDPERIEETTSHLARLAAARNGDGHWGTTADNAAALIALAARRRSGALQSAPIHDATAKTDGGIEVRLSSKDQNSSPAATLRPGGKPLRLRGPDACGAIVLRNVGTAPVSVQRSVVASPLPSSPAARPQSNGIDIKRRFMLTDGTAIDPSVGVPRGTTIIVAVDLKPGREVDAEHPIRDIVLDEWLPAGFEPEPHADFTSTTIAAIPANASSWIRHREVRDDRLVAFGQSITGPVTFHYVAQAVSAGTYILPPAVAEAMYDPAIRASTAVERIEITPEQGNENGEK